MEDLDASIRRQSYSAMANEIELLGSLILHINRGLAALSGTKHDRGLNFLTGLLLNRAFNSLWRAREDAVLGYAAECLTLCRSALEHWATARWVEFHQEAVNSYLWAILAEVERPDGRLPSTDAMLKDLGEVGEAPLAMYDILSKFAHPKSIGLSWMMHFDEHSTYFHAGGNFDERGLSTCLYFLTGVAQACLEPIARLQNRMLEEVDPEWLQTGRDLSEQAGEFVRRVEDEIVSEAEKLAG